MKTCTVKSVFDAITRLQGLDPLTAGMSDAQKAKYAELLNERLKEGWEDALWKEIMVVEQRNYRSSWDTSLTYADGEEVYNVADGLYYASLQDGNIGHAQATETTWWEEIDSDYTEFVRYIDFEQDGETEIDAVDQENCIFDKDPQIYPDAGRVPDVIVLGTKIICRSAEAPLQPYVRFRPMCPQFSWTEWSAATAYSIGDICYLAAYGESYKAIASSTNKNPYTETAYWEPVEFPAMFKNFVKHAVNADLLMEDEGRYKEEAKAQGELERLHDTLEDQAGVIRKIRFRGR